MKEDNTQSSPPARAKVTGVTVNVLMPNGNSVTLTVDTWRCEAIFWSDRAVNQMLAPFYDLIDREVEIDELVERFGPSIATIDSLSGKSGKVKMTPKIIEEMWMLPDDQGVLEPFMMKTIKCIPTPRVCRHGCKP
jgi:hypothetical protein